MFSSSYQPADAWAAYTSCLLGLALLSTLACRVHHLDPRGAWAAVWTGPSQGL